MKIAVIGYTGSGKSVLAAKLGKILGCPVLHLDKLQFEAGWKERKEAEGNRLCEQFLEENKERGWVIDGNYEKFCQKRRMKEADLIIFMDYPRWICLWQALRRYYRYKGHTSKILISLIPLENISCINFFLHIIQALIIAVCNDCLDLLCIISSNDQENENTNSAYNCLISRQINEHR